jgi:DNA repair protein RecO (recombination protein O)
MFVRDGGKIAVLAKGSRKPGSRYGAGLGLFSLSRVRYRVRANRDLVFLDSCELRRGFEDLTTDVYGYAAAGVCSELVDRLVPDGAPSGEIYDQLIAAVSALAETSPLPAGEELRAVAVPIAFQLRLMDILGIAPELTGCVACGGEDVGGSTSLSARRGGLLCARCRAAEGGRKLAAEAVAFLRSALYGEVGAVLSAPRPPSRGTILESRAALDAVLEYHHAGRPVLRSQRFLDELWRR